MSELIELIRYKLSHFEVSLETLEKRGHENGEVQDLSLSNNNNRHSYPQRAPSVRKSQSFRAPSIAESLDAKGHLARIIQSKTGSELVRSDSGSNRRNSFVSSLFNWTGMVGSGNGDDSTSLSSGVVNSPTAESIRKGIEDIEKDKEKEKSRQRRNSESAAILLHSKSVSEDGVGQVDQSEHFRTSSSSSLANRPSRPNSIVSFNMNPLPCVSQGLNSTNHLTRPIRPSLRSQHRPTRLRTGLIVSGQIPLPPEIDRSSAVSSPAVGSSSCPSPLTRPSTTPIDQSESYFSPPPPLHPLNVNSRFFSPKPSPILEVASSKLSISSNGLSGSAISSSSSEGDVDESLKGVDSSKTLNTRLQNWRD
jgi:hypothetical protein